MFYKLMDSNFQCIFVMQFVLYIYIMNKFLAFLSGSMNVVRCL